VLNALLNGKKVIATDPAWDHRKGEYRALCNEQAVCPICQERIICKFGEINQHHFAHRHNTDCPGSHDTEEHMTGKAILYVFLMARYGHEATVDLEYYIPELKTTCDLLVQFQDGRKWAVEFYCGGKAQALRDKINYYEEQNILTSWLLSQQLCKDNSSEKTVIISARDKLLIDKTGIDKYYIGEWYKRIVINRQRTDLPLDGSSEGTLMYLDVEQKELRIFRALQSEYHHNTYHYGSLLQGPLDEIVIKFSKTWGVNWYFEHEKELSGKYDEAKKVLKELPIRVYIRNNDNNFNTVKSERKKYVPPNHNAEFTSPYDNFSYRSDWGVKDAETPKMRYRCVICQKESDSGGMAQIFHYNQPEGVCQECSRKRDRQLSENRD